MPEDFEDAVKMHRAMSLLLSHIGYPTLAINAEENAQEVEQICKHKEES